MSAIRIPAHEQDVYRLLDRFEHCVAEGAPLTFATFKNLWKELSFSFIFEVLTCKVSSISVHPPTLPIQPHPPPHTPTHKRTKSVAVNERSALIPTSACLCAFRLGRRTGMQFCPCLWLLMHGCAIARRKETSPVTDALAPVHARVKYLNRSSVFHRASLLSNPLRSSHSSCWRPRWTC